MLRGTTVDLLGAGGPPLPTTFGPQSFARDPPEKRGSNAKTNGAQPFVCGIHSISAMDRSQMS